MQEVEQGTRTEENAGDYADADVLRSLIQVGVNLTTVADFRKMLDMILLEARKLGRAEAGTLYINRNNGLRLVSVQNDRLARAQIDKYLLNKELATSDSLAGYVATTGEMMNIPNTYVLPAGAPFRINRDFDAETGYRAKSILALPLKSPQGKCIGVLQLLNRLDEHGVLVPFPERACNGILSLASMAAVTIYNALLQEELRRAYLETIVRLSVAAEFRDDETSDHIRRISHTAAVIARAMDLSDKQVELIRYASPMHDVGKIGIPDAILRKPGKLTPEERTAIERHSAIGPEILGDPVSELTAVAREVALTHHERWDGRGYPKGLVGEAIPLCGRIVAIADVFDALVSKRCYKDPMPLDKALAVIKEEEGKAFDPAVVRAFFSCLEEILSFYRDPAVADNNPVFSSPEAAVPQWGDPETDFPTRIR
jgi:HD-GYP domain-containing protein (c-di-GMP phosphodiesterase class II)